MSLRTPSMQQVFNACWRANKQLLQSEGLAEDCLQRTWSALSSHVRENAAHGRGVSISGLCKILCQRNSGAKAAGRSQPTSTLSIVLSDKLLKRFTDLQLGGGISHYAAVREQVQGADNINFLALAQRCPGLNKDSVQLVLKVLLGTIIEHIAAQHSFTLDLGVGQLSFKAGRVADFRPTSGNLKGVASAPDAKADAGASDVSSSLNADALAQLGGKAAGAAAAGSTVSRVSRVSKASIRSSTTAAAAAAAAAGASTGPANSAGSSPALLGLAIMSKQLANSSNNSSSSSTGSIPDKPSNTSFSPDALIQAKRQAKAAAHANARVKAATFVLPTGGPNDDGGEQPMPQGKGKPAAAGAISLGRKQVLEVAAAQQQTAAAAAAAADAELAARNATLKAVLDQQACALLQQQKATKKQFADALAQQIREKQALSRQPEVPGGALLIPPPADPTAVSSQRLKQQAEYRAALDKQLADKASTLQQLKARDTERALAELALVQQSLVASTEASRSSRLQTAEAVRRQLDLQMQQQLASRDRL